MNAHALLSSQGWRGTGHSLHQSDDSIGLAKPLLLSRKNNTKGLGTTQHFTSDQWWMNAFDEQLKGLDTTKVGKVVQTVITGKLNTLDRGKLSKYSLYATFVRGGFLQGTISTLDDAEDSSGVESDKSDDKKAVLPRAEDSKLKKESKKERRARKEEKRRKREARALKRAARLERKSQKDKLNIGDGAMKKNHSRRAKKEEERRRREIEQKKKKTEKS